MFNEIYRKILCGKIVNYSLKLEDTFYITSYNGDVISAKIPIKQLKCDCGADSVKTTHSDWCSKKKVIK